MFVSNRIVFLKREFLREETTATKIKLGEVCEVEKQTPLSKNTELDLIGESNLKLIIEVLLRRSDKVLHQPDRYYDFLV